MRCARTMQASGYAAHDRRLPASLLHEPRDRSTFHRSASRTMSRQISWVTTSTHRRSRPVASDKSTESSIAQSTIAAARRSPAELSSRPLRRVAGSASREPYELATHTCCSRMLCRASRELRARCATSAKSRVVRVRRIVRREPDIPEALIGREHRRLRIRRVVVVVARAVLVVVGPASVGGVAGTGGGERGDRQDDDRSPHRPPGTSVRSHRGVRLRLCRLRAGNPPPRPADPRA